jgi:putative tryptophan/tyrosine transport system substrate-binding protein
MKRRDFLVGLALTAATANVQAQQRGKNYRLVVVDPINPVADLTEAGGLPYYRGFFERLRQLGFAAGENLDVKRFSGEGNPERFANMVSEVVNLKPDLIFVFSTRLLMMFKRTTTTIPVVSVMADPVRFGLVASLARPGGNITGVAHDAGVEFYRKRYQLFKEMVPRTSKLGVLVSRPFVEKTFGGAMVTEASRTAGIELILPFDVLYWREEDNRPAFERMVGEGVDGIVVTEQNENWAYRRTIIALAKEFRLPAIYPDGIFVELGGLMSFGPDWTNSGRDCARVAAEILNGASPSEIPISLPTKYELSLNRKTAIALGLELPPSLVLQADKVIE